MVPNMQIHHTDPNSSTPSKVKQYVTRQEKEILAIVVVTLEQFSTWETNCVEFLSCVYRIKRSPFENHLCGTPRLVNNSVQTVVYDFIVSHRNTTLYIEVASALYIQVNKRRHFGCYFLPLLQINYSSSSFTGLHHSHWHQW